MIVTLSIDEMNQCISEAHRDSSFDREATVGYNSGFHAGITALAFQILLAAVGDE